MSLLGLFIAVFIGIGLIAREIDRRSIYAVLAKPVRRHEFILGKYLGLVGTLLVNLAVMARGLLRGPGVHRQRRCRRRH